MTYSPEPLVANECGVDETSEKQACSTLDPMEASIMLHLYMQEPIVRTHRSAAAIGSLLKRGLIYKTENNGPVPFGNSSVAHEACRAICELSWADVEEKVLAIPVDTEGPTP